MSEAEFAARLVRDLDAKDVCLVLDVFRNDVLRLTGVLEAAAAMGDVTNFRRTSHALAGAAGAVGAQAFERACRQAMTRADLQPGELAATAAEIRRCGESALVQAATLQASLARP
ncbi:Hpt domain-containing protein [Rhodovastum atsumiense]|nr:Hpt domain-containing protein [Rhodovastum atsumiense]